MNILKATREYEVWLARQTPIVVSDLRKKHRLMAKSPFLFLRATFYRWIQLWPEACADLTRAPRVLGVGDLHLENFGTWRDTDGRLVWGINDFDEADQYAYTLDLVRLATSAVLAAREEHLALRSRDIAGAILEGYLAGMRSGGRPFVLAEDHTWLLEIAQSKPRDPVRFWNNIDRLPLARTVPRNARDAIEQLLPQRDLPCRIARRSSGLGSLGRMRFVAITQWHGGRLAREAKALVPSSANWLDQRVPRQPRYSDLLARSVRCPDPLVRCVGPWIVRRLSPDCSKIELDSLRAGRNEIRLLQAMGREIANIHLGTARQRKNILKDIAKRKGNWLRQAAEAMVLATQKDWRVWRENQEG